MLQAPGRHRGVTLIELMVVLVIAAILAAMAWPAFTGAMNKSRRADGISALSAITQAQERWRANNPSYQQDLAQLPAGTASPDNHYTLSIVDASATASGYRARATARSGSPQTSDSPCQVLEVEMAIGTLTYRSYSDAAGTANAAPDRCWAR